MKVPEVLAEVRRLAETREGNKRIERRVMCLRGRLQVYARPL